MAIENEFVYFKRFGVVDIILILLVWLCLIYWSKSNDGGELFICVLCAMVIIGAFRFFERVCEKKVSTFINLFEEV